MSETIAPKPDSWKPDLSKKPSLRWRFRRWLRLKLYGDARKPYEPTTEWGKTRSADRERRRAWERRYYVDRLSALTALVDPQEKYRVMRFREEDGGAIALEEKNDSYSSGWEIVDRFDTLEEASEAVAEAERLTRGKAIALARLVAERERPLATAPVENGDEA